ncbi:MULTISPECIES: hypothetical protein [Xanthobacter]|uniref:Uncharacterized protein n=1 Tax=Xanthobacter aminoxidans TaxID=186280 RepID=A0ABW6ZCG4_9HYPH|nr:hypothetical protein [Xanthobacter aminoxidans]MCL8383378.1 hypothetical protein [Xanthobacter aminoxidans]
MSIKSTVLAAGVAVVLVSSVGSAFADPTIQKENVEQYAVSAQGSLFPTSPAAVAREERRLERPSAFGTPGPYYVSERPFEIGNAQSGPAHDADDN